MVSKRIGLVLCAVLALAGCGGAEKAGPQSPSSPSYGYQPSAKGGVAAESTGGGDFSSPSTAPAPPASPGAHATAEAPRSAPADKRADRDVSGRQGLGTEWGESRSSRIHDVTFVRADASRPFAVVALHYNDRQGVEALANMHATRNPRTRDVDAGNGMISVSIRDSAGDPFEALRVGERTFVIGRAGERYSIVLENRSNHRFEAVGTVDGLDVINGKAGSLDHRGYVLMPFATLEIDGFRQSTSSVASFRFGAIGDSYAAQTGNARNVGVIGVAFFSERGDTFNDARDLRLRDSANPFPGSDPRFAQPPKR